MKRVRIPQAEDPARVPRLEVLPADPRGSDVGCLPAAGLAARPPGVRPGHDLRCTDYPELFFAESPDELAAAKALCQECRARAACLAGALERREPWGVWGGEVFLDGAIVSRKRPRGRPRKTDAAAQELGVRGNELPPRPAGLRAFVSGFERNPRTSPPRWPTAGGLAEASPSAHHRPRARPSLQSSAGQGFESP